jgi:phosphate transport system permease protein
MSAPTLDGDDGALAVTFESPDLPDEPRVLDDGLSAADRLFRGTALSVGSVALIITGAIGLFLGLQVIPTVHHYGFAFFTQTQWNPETNQLGIATVMLGTVEVAVIALTISFPLALLTALFVSEYSPAGLRSSLVAMVDLMAAVPSIIYGIWGSLLIMPHAIYISRWLNEYFHWIPGFAVTGTDPHAAVWAQSRFVSSAFIAGIVVSMMVTPIATAVMIGVFRQAPLGEREGALALGSTKWGVIRSVVLPFGRGGIIGGTMLGLGRALGETIAVVLIISPDFTFKWRPLEVGTITVSSLIANLFGESTNVQLSALLAAGFALFVLTLIVNTIAGVIVTRSRSGAMTDI